MLSSVNYQQVASPVNLTTALVSTLISQLLTGSTPGLTIGSLFNIDPRRLFWIMPICGNISRCQRCTQEIARGPVGRTPLPPPDNLVVQHKDQVMLQNPKSGNFQISHDFQNVYYHAHMACIKKKYPTFVGVQHLCLNDDVMSQLCDSHIIL